MMANESTSLDGDASNIGNSAGMGPHLDKRSSPQLTRSPVVADPGGTIAEDEPIDFAAANAHFKRMRTRASYYLKLPRSVSEAAGI